MTIPIERDWKSDPITGELVLDDGTGDIAMVSDSDGHPDSIRQDTEERLGYVRGEWFIDPQDPDAVPMYEKVLVKAPNLVTVRAAYEAAILGTPGVTGIVALTLNFDQGLRVLRIRFTASTDAGQITSALQVKVGG